MAAMSEFSAGRACVLAGDAFDIAVFLSPDGRYFAIEDRCPHRGAPLSQGVMYEPDLVACLDHGWGICLVDGQVEAPNRGCARVFSVRVEAGEVQVLIES